MQKERSWVLLVSHQELKTSADSFLSSNCPNSVSASDQNLPGVTWPGSFATIPLAGETSGFSVKERQVLLVHTMAAGCARRRHRKDAVRLTTFSRSSDERF